MILVLVRHHKTRRLELASWEGLPLHWESRDDAYADLGSFVVDFIDTEFQMWGIPAQEWKERSNALLF